MNGNIPKIGLALGVGGIRGFVHLGVIKALEKNKIPIDFIAGSSAGALIGGTYAVFGDIKKVEEIIFSVKIRDFILLFDPSLQNGIIKGKRIEDFLEGILGEISFKDLKIPFISVATNLKTGKTENLLTGSVAKAIRASIGVPLFFKPVISEGKMLSDGGLSNPVPVDVVRKMGADIVIAVNLNNQDSIQQLTETNLYSIGMKSIAILEYNMAEKCTEQADILIKPVVLSDGIRDIKKIFNGELKNTISIGEEATEKIIPKIKELIKIKK